MNKYSLLLFMLLWSCEGREVAIPLEFEGERLVVFGRLEVGEPFKVELRKTFPAVGQIPENITVGNADITVYKEGVFLGKLKPSEKEGEYISDFLVEAGAVYKLEASADNLPVIESEEVKIPNGLVGFRFYKDNGNFNLSFDQNLVSPVSVKMLGYFKNETVSLSVRYISDNILFQSEECNTYDRYYGFGYLFRSECLNIHPILEFMDEDNYQYFERVYGTLLKKTITVYSFSHEWFEYINALESQPDGLDLMVLPLQKTYTNIKNGYGLVYGYNSKEIEF